MKQNPENQTKILKSILKTPSKSDFKIEELFISDLSIKNDEQTGKIKKVQSKITFKEDIKVTYIASFKKYNETGEYSSDDGNCTCKIF